MTLQDVDRVRGSTGSKSILTPPGIVGQFKTSAVAKVLESRGFVTTLIERPFSGSFEHDPTSDSTVLVRGVDNALARSQLEAPDYPFVVKAGIGPRPGDYRALRMQTFASSGKSVAAS